MNSTTFIWAWYVRPSNGQKIRTHCPIQDGHPQWSWSSNLPRLWYRWDFRLMFFAVLTWHHLGQCLQLCIQGISLNISFYKGTRLPLISFDCAAMSWDDQRCIAISGSILIIINIPPRIVSKAQTQCWGWSWLSDCLVGWLVGWLTDW